MEIERPNQQLGPVRPKVLLLDDEEAVRQSLSRYLKLTGFDVLAVASVDEAFDTLRRTAIDAFVLDVHLPADRSGLEVLEFLRLGEDAPDRPVIILTGQMFIPLEEDIVRRHSAHVFYKPHGYADLVHRLTELLHRA